MQLLPLMWLALLSLTLSLLAVLKWLLVNRVKATSYQKYSWAFQTKALNAAVQVCILLPAHEQQPISQSMSQTIGLFQQTLSEIKSTSQAFSPSQCSRKALPALLNTSLRAQTDLPIPHRASWASGSTAAQNFLHACSA